jgi:rhamnose utilization protein RhaD (predicted bifunctional aldolase and dehydrogenase)/NAD(P)-dependent dehydrogenase (short-subunit alcohol dehydrogenase family)
MKSRWNDSEAEKYADDPLKMRVYTSRLIGLDADLVLHGGGNTSVKGEVTNLFGETVEVLFVKGSGWDLATIEAEGFAPVRLDVLKKMAELKNISDSDMVKGQRAAMTDSSAPNPSVETILHTIIPFKFVDHTHADAVVTVTNTPEGEAHIRKIYGDKILIVPYVKAGFVLAKEVYELTKDIKWDTLEGIVLLNHGIFSFDDDARKSYEKMIDLVTKAEDYIKEHGGENSIAVSEGTPQEIPHLEVAKLRKVVSDAAETAMITKVLRGKDERGFAGLQNVSDIATRGPLTPDHVFRAKHIPMIMSGNTDGDVHKFAKNYRDYFDRNTEGKLNCLDPAPRWAVWPGQGLAVMGKCLTDINIVSGIAKHTIRAIQWGELIGGWKALTDSDIFEIEYWELEQAKLKKGGTPPPFQGKIALVTGAAGGIGKACVEALSSQGAVVVGLDINPEIEKNSDLNLGVACDVTDQKAIRKAIEQTIEEFGGLDILVSNAGTFPSSSLIEDQDTDAWNKSMGLNLNSHRALLQECIPYLKYGIDPAVVFIGSKNVPAPGPGASAYSVAKAGLTQLARVAALELGQFGIRVNVTHPNMVFDTAIWTKEVLESRANNYGMTVEEYKTNNLLKTEVTSKNVAELVVTMAGPAFAKTTGAQIPIDGGNDRVV